MPVTTLVDNTNRQTDAGTLRFNVAASANGNTTLSATTANGTITELCHAMILGNSANISAGGNIVVYDGAPGAGNIVYTVVGNSTNILTLQTIKAPIKNGSVTLSGQANCPAAWFSFFSAGPNGQPGNLT